MFLHLGFDFVSPVFKSDKGSSGIYLDDEKAVILTLAVTEVYVLCMQ